MTNLCLKRVIWPLPYLTSRTVIPSMDKQILANWEDYATVKQWKRGLKVNSHSNRLSEKTLESLRIWMPLFVEYTQKSPDEIIEEALNGKETIRTRLSDFCTWLQQEKEKKFNASVNAAYSVIRGFYSHNDVNTQKIRSPKLKPTEVQNTDDLVPLFDIVDMDGQKKKILRCTFIRDYLECMAYRDKVVNMCLISCGMDDGDLLKLPLATIRYQDPNSERIFIRNFRNKTGEIINTFFTKETTKIIKSYEQKYRKDAPDSEPIFSKKKSLLKQSFAKNHGRQFDGENDDLDFEAIDPHILTINNRNAVKKLEKLLSSQEKSVKFLQSKKQSPLRPKRWRKLFNDVCDAAGVPTDIKRIFMGKSDPANKPYGGKSKQDLEMYYEMVESNLTIFSEPDTKPSSHETEELKRQMEEMKRQQVDENARRDQALEYLMKKEREREEKSKKF